MVTFRSSTNDSLAEAVPPWDSRVQHLSAEQFESSYRGLADLVDKWLRSVVEGDSTLSRAMRYSLLAGGKRFRPVLCLAAGEMLGIQPAQLRPYALALECLHAATLIHDDLPALDDDTMRRGQPTCHVQFDEATAILAGDALIVESFRLVASASEMRETARNQLGKLLAEAAHDVCLGQVMDLEARHSDQDSDRAWRPERSLEERHRKKTGALIRAAVCGPAAFLMPLERERVTEVLSAFGEQLGLLYQITDDILDTTGTDESLGKDSSSDERHGVPTYVSVYGLNEAKLLAHTSCEKASGLLAEFGEKADFLRALCDYVLHRQR